jgi:arylsulfatase A-like enzyme
MRNPGLAIFSVSVSLLLLPFLASGGSPSSRGTQPNILFLFSDDQAFDALGAMGNDQIQTPNLDRLARRGLLFTHAYSMGSWHGAVCMPSRGMLNTGRFLWDFQRVDRQMEEERRAGRLWSELLKQAGYRSYMAGKWHVRIDAARTFDVTGSVRPGMPNVFPERHPHAYNRPREGFVDSWDPANPEEGGFWEGGTHWSEVLADEAIGFLEAAAQDERPFFMYVAFNAPHDPRQAPREYLDRYPIEAMRVPANFLPEYPYKDEIGSPHTLRDEFLAPMPRTEHAVRVHRSEYYAIITHMDAQIGRVLDALDRSGQADNTWIFFTSDHGLAVGQHGLMGKQNLYDHSVRVPFLAVGPGVPAGERTSEPIYYQDVMPTTLELAGIDRPQHVSYQSLLPILRGEGGSTYSSIYTAYMNLQRSVIQDGWKLLVYPKAGVTRLYQVAADPNEVRDLAGDGQHAGRIDALFRELLDWQRRTGDTLALGDRP